jgi:murein tripeptide amidase MpaA
MSLLSQGFQSWNLRLALRRDVRFEINQEQNLMELKEALETRTYKPSRPVCFFATRPKLREMLDRLHAVLSSYLVHFKMANSYNLCKSIGEKHTFLDEYFDFDPEACRLTRKYKYPAGIRRTCQQYFYYRWRFTGDVLLFQVWRFFGFYSEHDKEVASIIDLARIRKNRRGVKYGFPVHMINIYIQRLFRYNTSISVILEREQYPGGIKKRAPAYRLESLARR